MKNIYLSITALLVGILLADMDSLNTFFNEIDMRYLTNTSYILPVFFSLILFVIKDIYDISLYTDETIPLKLSILSLVMAIIGFLVFYRILLLGMFLLIFASHWNRGIIKSYYPQKRIRKAR